MSKLEAMQKLTDEQPEGEVKTVMQDLLNQVQKLDKLQAEYNQFSAEERKQLPESVREFFCDAVTG